MQLHGEIKAKDYRIMDIPLEAIELQRQMIREIAHDDDLQNLAASIAQTTMLQLPGVRTLPGGRYELCWGRRRFEAHKILRRATMPCRVYDCSAEQVKILAGIENLIRRQMNLAEECRYVADLNTIGNLSVNELVEQTGHTRAWILTRLAIPNFPVDVRESLLDGAISLGAAEEVAKVEDDGQRAYILNQAIYTKAPISELRKMVEIARSTPSQPEAIEAAIRASQETYLPQDALIACAACGAHRLIPDLINVRVCRGGCKEPTNEPHPVETLS